MHCDTLKRIFVYCILHYYAATNSINICNCIFKFVLFPFFVNSIITRNFFSSLNFFLKDNVTFAYVNAILFSFFEYYSVHKLSNSANERISIFPQMYFSKNETDLKFLSHESIFLLITLS